MNLSDPQLPGKAVGAGSGQFEFEGAQPSGLGGIGLAASCDCSARQYWKRFRVASERPHQFLPAKRVRHACAQAIRANARWAERSRRRQFDGGAMFNFREGRACLFGGVPGQNDRPLCCAGRPAADKRCAISPSIAAVRRHKHSASTAHNSALRGHLFGHFQHGSASKQRACQPISARECGGLTKFLNLNQRLNCKVGRQATGLMR